MKIHATRELFESVIFSPSIHKKLGISSSAVRSIRFRIRHGRWPSSDKIRKLLQLAGYQVAVSQSWIHTTQSRKLDHTRKKLQHILLDPHFDPDLKELLRQHIK